MQIKVCIKLGLLLDGEKSEQNPSVPSTSAGSTFIGNRFTSILNFEHTIEPREVHSASIRAARASGKPTNSMRPFWR